MLTFLKKSYIMIIVVVIINKFLRKNMIKYNVSLTVDISANDEEVKQQLLKTVNKVYGFKLKIKEKDNVKKGSFFIINEKNEEETFADLKSLSCVKEIKVKEVKDNFSKKKTEEKTDSENN